MDRKEIYSRVDHTLLGQDATWSQIKEICDDAMAYGTASVCIPPSYVKRAKEYVGDRMAVCTVIGFPNGYNTTAVKVFETKDAIANGADEIDMVINIGDCLTCTSVVLSALTTNRQTNTVTYTTIATNIH